MAPFTINSFTSCKGHKTSIHMANHLKHAMLKQPWIEVRFLGYTDTNLTQYKSTKPQITLMKVDKERERRGALISEFGKLQSELAELEELS